MHRAASKLRAVKFRASDLTPMIEAIVGERTPEGWRYVVRIDGKSGYEYVYVSTWRGERVDLLVTRRGEWWRLTHPCMVRRRWEKKFPDAMSLMEHLGWEYEEIDPCRKRQS